MMRAPPIATTSSVMPFTSEKAAISASRTSAPSPGFTNITSPNRIETSPLRDSRTASSPSIGSQNVLPIAMTPNVMAYVAMTYNSPSAEMLGQSRTARPTPSRLDSTVQPRPSLTLVMFIRPTTPLAVAYAPNRIVSAYRPMPGQARIIAPNSTDRAPLIPIAQRTRLTVCAAVVISGVLLQNSDAD